MNWQLYITLVPKTDTPHTPEMDIYCATGSISKKYKGLILVSILNSSQSQEHKDNTGED